MIRVNLLPIKEARRRSAGRIQLLVFTAIIILEVAGLVALYFAKSGQVTSVQKKLNNVSTDVQKLEKEVEELKDYEKKADQLQKKLGVLNEIEKKSGGPAKVLSELQDILTRPANIEERYAQRKKDWNVEWNPSHLWIEMLKESKGDFELKGKAVDADDVAEFLHRLETAAHFNGVQLDFVRPADDEKQGGKVVEFRVTGTVKYRVEEKDDEGKGS